jgi:hypothetical protein
MAYIAIVYHSTWHEFEVAQQFPTRAEALAFARARSQSAVVVCQGTIDEWVADSLRRPDAIFWRGELFLPSPD